MKSHARTGNWWQALHAHRNWTTGESSTTQSVACAKTRSVNAAQRSSAGITAKPPFLVLRVALTCRHLSKPLFLHGPT
eukprot:11194213-Lingulodinium_polyedra.AAC.1